METNKLHAKDYLIDYIAKNEATAWLNLLIQKVIDLNGDISITDKDKIFNELLKENKIEVLEATSENEFKLTNEKEEQPKKSELLTNDVITLRKITHIKGVNAIIPNQCIAFSPSCTIIYGLNGTGKSGYFRIINELAGGTKTKEILDNIHKETNGFEVDVEFMLNNIKQDTFEWRNKSLRGLVPFNQIRVFDSEYMPFFLNERENCINVEPLGLNLFQIITKVIDEFKDRLLIKAANLTAQAPELSNLINILHSSELKRLLEKKFLTVEENCQLNSIEFSDQDLERLEQLRADKIFLEKDNTEDSKKVLVQEKNELDSLKAHLDNLKINIEALTNDVSIAVDDYIEKKKERDTRIKQFELFNSIPAQDLTEWQAFIESGEEYRSKINSSLFDPSKKCIYCHQALSDGEALKRVKTYYEYLNDQSQNNFKNSASKINIIKNKINELSVDYQISQSLLVILSSISDVNNESYLDILNKILVKARDQIDVLNESVKNIMPTSRIYILNLFDISDKLLGLSKIKQQLTVDLQQSNGEKKAKIDGILIDIKDLEDKQRITKSIDDINKYISCHQQAKDYSDISGTIGTVSITKLSSKAHDELLTETIKKSFEAELNSLGKNIDVNLEKVSADKGVVRTKLKILGNNVRDILSDGEQKAVALALFLSEIEWQNDGSPIVFDDPVTSIDHEVADFLAKKLLQMSINRQIIIFTHNKLFYNSLIHWSKNLKNDNDIRTHHVCGNYTVNGCSGKGLHVLTYRVDRESKDKTGKIFEAQNESLEYYIKKAENEMNSNYSLSCVCGYLKSAIEYYIDEKILLNHDLMKNRMRGCSVPWESLKKIDSKIEKIEKLKTHWDNLSSRGTHLTENMSQTPLSNEELSAIVTFLKS